MIGIKPGGSGGFHGGPGHFHRGHRGHHMPPPPPPHMFYGRHRRRYGGGCLGCLMYVVGTIALFAFMLIMIF